jgi:sulfonate transport system substrate-binding protein
MKRRTLVQAGLASAAALSFPAAIRAQSASNPSVIRIAVPNAGTGGRPLTTQLLGTLHQKATFEDEFRKDGIQVKWTFFPSAGPGVNEAHANGLVDFAGHGDLPLIVGRSTGLKHRIISTYGRFSDVYFTVPADSPAKTLADLKGKRLATNKGTASQLQLARILARNNLSERDFRVVSADNDTTKASLATKDIDGTTFTPAPYDLEARGIARILFGLKDAGMSTPSTLWVSEDFEKKYPHLVQRFVTALTRQAAWAADEKNREEQFQLWAKAGAYSYIDFKRSWDGDKLKDKLSPLIDDYYVAALQKAIKEARDCKLIRRDVSVDGWIEPKYQKQALKELGLENFWTEYDAAGKAKSAA